jgi:hypothetical protein
MKKSRLFVLFGSFTLGLLAVCWCRAQAPSHPLKVMDPSTGKEIHTLMVDQHNALLAQLEAAGQTNAIELFREYRCAYGADNASSELGYTVAALRFLREARTTEAIQLLEQHVRAYGNLTCNTYGCLNATNRSRVNLGPLKQARDYFAEYPLSAWGPEMDKAVNEILRLSEKPKQ